MLDCENKQIKLYHRQVMWDDYFDYVCRKMMNNREVVVSEHAYNSFNDRDIDKGFIFSMLKYNRKGEIFEVEKQGKYIEKFVIRLPYDLKSDICVVLRNRYDEETNTPYLLMVTLWLNNRNDNHYTLDDTKYEKKY